MNRQEVVQKLMEKATEMRADPTASAQVNITGMSVTNSGQGSGLVVTAAGDGSGKSVTGLSVNVNVGGPVTPSASDLEFVAKAADLLEGIADDLSSNDINQDPILEKVSDLAGLAIRVSVIEVVRDWLRQIGIGD